MHPDLLSEYLEIIQRHRLSVDETAVFTGIATHTVRLVKASRALPQRERCVRAIGDFVARNRAATGRHELRMPAPTPDALAS
jgi:hypothetical protein